MTGDRLIRAGTAAVVAFAAIVSYSHIYDLGRLHGQAGTAARLLPLSVDGLILAAILAMLHEARNGRRAPALARFMLGLGVAATVGANVAYGSAFGVLGAVISAWPAVAFIGSVEMAMGLVRAVRAGPAVARTVPPSGEDCALTAYRASVAAGEPLSARQLAARHDISRRQAGQVVAAVSRESNGHGPG